MLWIKFILLKLDLVKEYDEASQFTSKLVVNPTVHVYDIGLNINWLWFVYLFAKMCSMSPIPSRREERS